MWLENKSLCFTKDEKVKKMKENIKASLLIANNIFGASDPLQKNNIFLPRVN